MSFQAWKYISLFLLLLFEFSDCADVNFCSKNYKCKKESNVVCALGHNCGVSKHCKGYTHQSISPSNKKLLVFLHNFYRNKIAVQRVLPNIDKIKLSTAADMNELVWDKELEFLAQCWANQCPSTPKDLVCFKNSAGVQLGQILKHSTASTFSYNMTMQDIYLDITYVTPNDIDSYNWNRKNFTTYMIHNFMQLVYANASQFGCARSRFYSEVFDEKVHLLACLYNRAIFPNGKIYIAGKPCSLCRSCNKKFEGLCSTKQSNSNYPNICKYSNSTNCTSIIKFLSDSYSKRESSAPELCKYAIKVIFFIWITIQTIKDF